MQMCSLCDKPAYRCRIDLDTGKRIGMDCGCGGRDRSGESCHSPYEALTLQHLRGDDGKPITVNSVMEMGRIEQKYGVQHACTSFSESYIPPDWQAPSLKDLMRPQEQRQRGQFRTCVDGHGVVSGNGFTARVRRG